LTHSVYTYMLTYFLLLLFAWQNKDDYCAVQSVRYNEVVMCTSVYVVGEKQNSDVESAEGVDWQRSGVPGIHRRSRHTARQKIIPGFNYAYSVVSPAGRVTQCSLSVCSSLLCFILKLITANPVLMKISTITDGIILMSYRIVNFVWYNIQVTVVQIIGCFEVKGPISLRIWE